MTHHLPPTKIREKWLARVSMSLDGRNCWALSSRGAFLATTPELRMLYDNDLRVLPDIFRSQAIFSFLNK